MNNSPAPGTPQTPTKAIVSGIATGIATFASIWITDNDPFTNKEIVEALIAGAAASGLVGLATFSAKNKPTAP